MGSYCAVKAPPMLRTLSRFWTLIYLRSQFVFIIGVCASAFGYTSLITLDVPKLKLTKSYFTNMP